ncbi:MAG TPA: YXWGXW repeat-containing protein [Steroidobacteraceae bacterium]|nr:YXWGXW repeat-containing protein [Steroidobacteraceae bacterium]
MNDYDIRLAVPAQTPTARSRAPVAAVFALCAGALLAFSGRTASAGVVIDIGVAPPPPPVVVAPVPRPGFIWAPGYYVWNGHRHVWHDGYWVHARPGYHWVADAWVPRHGRYHFVRGHWAR